MTWTHWNCHQKPSLMDFCLSCGHFEWSHNQFKTILNLGPKLAKNGWKRPQMTKNGLNVWKVTSETISIGFLLLLRSFWVVTWLVCNNFEFGAKIGQKWPKKALNDQKKRPKSLKMTSETISIGVLLFLWSFWVVTWLLCYNFKFEAKIDQNGQKRPKKAKNDQKWPKCL